MHGVQSVEASPPAPDHVMAVSVETARGTTHEISNMRFAKGMYFQNNPFFGEGNNVLV